MQPIEPPPTPATPAPIRRERFSKQALPNGSITLENIPNITWDPNDQNFDCSFNDISQSLISLGPQYHVVSNNVLLQHIFSIPCPQCQTITKPQKLEMSSGTSISCHLVCRNCNTRSYYSTLPTTDGKVSSPTIFDDTLPEALLFSGSRVAGVAKFFEFLGVKIKSDSGLYNDLRDERFQIHQHVLDKLDVLLETCMFYDTLCLHLQ